MYLLGTIVPNYLVLKYQMLRNATIRLLVNFLKAPLATANEP